MAHSVVKQPGVVTLDTDDVSDRRRLFTIKETCLLLATSRTTLYKAFAAGRLRTVRLGKKRMVAAADLDAFVELLRSEIDAVPEK